MFNGYRVVCVTPAGRRRYLQTLVPYILNCPVVDEYRLWRNTTDIADTSYLYSLEERYSKISVVEPDTPAGINYFATIAQFFRGCIEDDVIYVRLDDDIVYLDDTFFEALLQFRCDNPRYFLIFPSIINNAICTYIHVQNGIIDPETAIFPWCMDRNAWGSPRFAEQLHDAFLVSASARRVSDWYFNSRELAFTWFSVNAMTWFGRDFALFDGVVEGNEEEYLTIRMPSSLQRINCVFGRAIAAHYAFYTQRTYLDSTNILARYADLKERNHSSRPTREGFRTTRNLWTARLVTALDRIAHAPPDDLRRWEWLTEIVRYAGLSYDPHGVYGEDNGFMNTGSAGLRVMPMQFAKCLVELSEYDIHTILDIGTGSGWAITLMTAYLSRFNDDLSATTIDMEDHFKAYPEIRERVPISFCCGTSLSYQPQFVDLVRIDECASYQDYGSTCACLCEKARLCMLHETHGEYIGSSQGSATVDRLWTHIKATKGPMERTVEYADHERKTGDYMGIRLIISAETQRGL